MSSTSASATCNSKSLGYAKLTFTSLSELLIILLNSDYKCRSSMAQPSLNVDLWYSKSCRQSHLVRFRLREKKKQVYLLNVAHKLFVSHKPLCVKWWHMTVLNGLIGYGSHTHKHLHVINSQIPINKASCQISELLCLLTSWHYSCVATYQWEIKYWSPTAPIQSALYIK